MKKVWYDLKEYYTGQSYENKPIGNKNDTDNKNSLKYTLLNLFLKYVEISKHIPNDSTLKEMMEKEQETLHDNLLKTDIPNLLDYSSIFNCKV